MKLSRQPSELCLAGLQLRVQAGHMDHSEMPQGEVGQNKHRADHPLRRHATVIEPPLSVHNFMKLGVHMQQLHDPEQGALNDWSPTVVQEERFSTADTSVTSQDSITLEQFIESVLSRHTYDCDPIFLEQFQYTVATSHVLNYSERATRNRVRSTNNVDQFVKPTGKIYQGIAHFTNIYNISILTCIRMIRRLRRVNQKRRKDIELITREILYHLSSLFRWRQEYIAIRNEMIIQEIQGVLKLMVNFETQYHELWIQVKQYKDSDSTVNSLHDKSEIYTIVENVLKCNITEYYYKLKLILRQISPVTNKQTLKRYCEMYNIHSDDIQYYISDTFDVALDQLQIIKALQKFFLCCLLSIDVDINAMNTTIYRRSNNIMDRDTDLWYQIFTLLKSINTTLTHSLVSILEYETFISASITNTKSSCGKENTNDNRNKQDIRLSKLLHIIHGIVVSSASERNDSPMGYHKKQFIINKLEGIVDTLTEENKVNYDDGQHSLIESNSNSIYNVSTRSHDQRVASALSTQYPRGFSLNIIKNHSYSNMSENRIHLDGKINFTNVPNTDIFSEHDIYTPLEGEQHTNNTNNTVQPLSSRIVDSQAYDHSKSTNFLFTDIPYVSQSNGTSTLDYVKPQSRHYEGFKKLSDDELRKKLDEKITDFALENKRGKGRLRAQKSFELLRRHFQRKGQESAKQINSEETIPVIYELQQLVDA